MLREREACSPGFKHLSVITSKLFQCIWASQLSPQRAELQKETGAATRTSIHSGTLEAAPAFPVPCCTSVGDHMHLKLTPELYNWRIEGKMHFHFTWFCSLRFMICPDSIMTMKTAGLNYCYEDWNNFRWRRKNSGCASFCYLYQNSSFSVAQRPGLCKLWFPDMLAS